MVQNSQTYVDLDFDTLKTQLKTALQNNEVFKDYDYEGSNINLLLDLLSYNTNKNAFLINMALAEAFLDSARLKSSVISHAKDLNYIPYSKRSAKANVSVTFEASGDSQPYIIEKGSLFSSIVKNEAYTFSVPQAITVSSATVNSESNNYIFSFDTDIYEGYYVKDSYIFTANLDTVGTYPITNPDVDINSLTVAVYEDATTTPALYTRAETILDLTGQSNVYFLQAVGHGYYEVLFGNGVFGRVPKDGSRIVLDYRVCNGSEGNGAKLFSMDFDPTDSNEMASYSITTNANASSGAEEQDVESIRVLAPRYFATQQRAVGNDDFKSTILARFNGFLSDVNVFGGEELEPKQYGRVVLALKPISGLAVSNNIKQEIQNYLLTKTAIPIRTITTDPEYIHCRVEASVQYNTHDTSKTDSEIREIVRTAIKNHSLNNLELFDNDFRYSRFVKAIDEADPSIISNDTDILLIKKLSPVPNQYNTFNIKLQNRIHPARGPTFPPVVTSTAFTYIDSNNVSWSNSYIKDDGENSLVVYTFINGVETILNDSIGTVDHSTGALYISNLLLSDYGNYLKIYALPIYKDIVINNNHVIVIDLEDVIVNVTGVIE